MKTTSFSKNFIIFGQLMTIMLIANTLTAAKSKKQNKAKTPEFQEDQCFCGIRFDKTKKLNLDLFGAGIAGKILNYVDQSISKFNGLNMTSELALVSAKNKLSNKSNYYVSSERFMKQKTIQGNVDKNGVVYNKLRITYMKTVLFTVDENKNNIMVLDFMMGHKVSFKITIKFLDTHKKQFDLSFVQIPYIPGNPAKTQELIRKNNYTGYKTFRSLSHFDKNQLQVDICRMMYTALNQISMREFNTSISDHIVQFGKTRKTFTKATGCKRDVVFRQRYSDDYLTGIAQTYYSKLQKKTVFKIRAKLDIGETNNFKVVIQDFNENENELTRQASQNKIDLFNDKSDETEENETSEKSNLDNEETVVETIDIDQDEETSSQNSSVKSSQRIEDIGKLDLENKNQAFYNLRNRDVPKTLPQNSSETNSSHSSENKSKIKNDEFKSMSNEDVYHLRNRDVPKIISNGSPNKSVRSESHDIQDHLENDNLSSSNNSESYKTGNNKSFNSDSYKTTKDDFELTKNNTSETSELKIVEVEVNDKKKKRKRVIVLIESIECSKCKNDIKTEVFLRLLNNKSFMI